MQTKTAVQSLAALAHETRLEIFRGLVQVGPSGIAAGAIAEGMGIAPATLSFHLNALSQAGLVRSRQEGRFVFYAADYAAMNELLRYLTEDCCGGLGCGEVVDACATESCA